MQPMSVFLDIEKFEGFWWKGADFSKTQGVCHAIHIFFASTLGKDLLCQVNCNSPKKAHPE